MHADAIVPHALTVAPRRPITLGTCRARCGSVRPTAHLANGGASRFPPNAIPMTPPRALARGTLGRGARCAGRGVVAAAADLDLGLAVALH